MIQVKLYDSIIHKNKLIKFCDQCMIEDNENNSSIEKLAFEKRKNSGVFLIFHCDEIIGLSYTHDFGDYYINSWRVFARTATLKKFRGKFIPRSRSMISCAGVNSYSIPHQVKFAKSHGAKIFLWTTNYNSGYEGSNKLDNFLFKIENNDPRFQYYDRRNIYGVEQNVWQLLYGDILNLKNYLV